MNSACELSVVISTYQRSEMLAEALESVLFQDRGPTYEVIVVDNNSTDRTRDVVQSFIPISRNRLRYLFEPRQGVSYARNKGITNSTAPIVAFFDDDVKVSPDWVARIKQTLDEFPDVDCVGGPVLPLWENEPPPWLTRHHWAPVAIQDYGDRPIYVDRNNPICLLSANLAFRRSALERIGLFAPELQRVRDGIGSMEDLELLHRLWQMNLTALYVPTLKAETAVPASRMTRSYHRRWHTGHGRFYAMLQCEEMERTRAGKLFGVPGHLYRQGLESSRDWLRDMLSGKPLRAFDSEMRLRFILGFFSKRVSTLIKSNATRLVGEMSARTRSILGR